MQSQQNNSLVKKVCIIGAGPCGILSIKHIKQIPNVQLDCFEFKNDIGGLWNYQDKNEEKLSPQELEKNKFYQEYQALNSSIYDGMIVNIPKQAMAFKGHPMPLDCPDFPTAEQFQTYMQDYCQKNDIKKYIKFNTYVDLVSLIKNMNQQEKNQLSEQFGQQEIEKRKYKVDYFYKNEKQTGLYDYVVCSNGHFTTPIIPKLKNQETWDGKIEHCHYFRRDKLQQYENKNVLILGVRASGMDFLCMLAKWSQYKPKKIYFVGNPVYLNKLKQLSEAYKNDFETGFIELKTCRIHELIQGKKVVLIDQNTKELQTLNDIDNILLCTGYKYSMPFLEKNQKKDNIIEYYNQDSYKNAFGPLYKALISIREPTLFFPGLINGHISIQINFERQAIVIKQIIEGKIQLPTQKDMMDDFQKHYDMCQEINPNLNSLFKGNLQQGDLTLKNYTYTLHKMVKDIEIDEEFENLVDILVEKIKPIQLFNYPYLKGRNYAGKDTGIPLHYASNENKF